MRFFRRYLCVAYIKADPMKQQTIWLLGPCSREQAKDWLFKNKFEITGGNRYEIFAGRRQVGTSTGLVAVHRHFRRADVKKHKLLPLNLSI